MSNALITSIITVPSCLTVLCLLSVISFVFLNLFLSFLVLSLWALIQTVSSVLWAVAVVGAFIVKAACRGHCFGLQHPVLLSLEDQTTALKIIGALTFDLQRSKATLGRFVVTVDDASCSVRHIPHVLALLCIAQ